MKRVCSWDALRFFSRHEFSAPDLMSFDFLILLDLARSRAGVPFRIASSFRNGDPGSHGDGLAVDIACSTSTERLRIVRALLEVGFQRVGIYRRHVHVDVDESRDQLVLWYGTYHSDSTEEVSDEAETDDQEQQ